MLCDMFGWNWPSGSEDENLKSLRTDRRTAGQVGGRTTDNRRWKAHLSFQLRWAKNPKIKQKQQIIKNIQFFQSQIIKRPFLPFASIIFSVKTLMNKRQTDRWPHKNIKICIRALQAEVLCVKTTITSRWYIPSYIVNDFVILAVINVTPLTGVLDKYDNVIDIHYYCIRYVQGSFFCCCSISMTL